MRPFEPGRMSPSVVTARPAGSGATSLLSKGHFQYGGHGNVVDISNSTNDYSPVIDCASVPTAIQLHSRLKSLSESQDPWIVIPATRISGDDAILGFNLSVWPQWIQSQMATMLSQMGGVLLESRTLEKSEDLVRKFRVQQATKPGTKPIVTPAEHATDDDDPPSNPTS